jgi:hypothetical protein
MQGDVRLQLAESTEYDDSGRPLATRGVAGRSDTDE